MPDLVEVVSQAKANIFGTLNQNDQQRVTVTVTDQPKKSFEELIEQAERQPSPVRNDELANAILFAGDSVSFERLFDAAGKIDDTELRDKIVDWLYFGGAQRALNEKRLSDAKVLAGKVAELDQKAYLYLRIAEDSMTNTQNSSDARQLLEEIVSITARAPDTEMKGRALLGTAYLYTKVDANRSMAILGDAVRCINRIESPDFTSNFTTRRIEGKTFGNYVMLYTPGFNPENGFREIAKYDFDGTFYLARTFVNKSLRSLTTLALAELCLQKSQKPPESKKKSVTPRL
jgi:hypothetical protein